VLKGSEHRLLRECKTVKNRLWLNRHPCNKVRNVIFSESFIANNIR